MIPDLDTYIRLSNTLGLTSLSSFFIVMTGLRIGR
jgi:hypothetical protein